MAQLVQHGSMVDEADISLLTQSHRTREGDHLGNGYTVRRGWKQKFQGNSMGEEFEERRKKVPGRKLPTEREEPKR